MRRIQLVALATFIALVGCQPQPPVPTPEEVAALEKAAAIKRYKAQIEAIEAAERERFQHPSATPPGNAWWREDDSKTSSEPQPTESTGSKK